MLTECPAIRLLLGQDTPRPETHQGLRCPKSDQPRSSSGAESCTWGGFHFFQQHLGDVVDAPQVFCIRLLCPGKRNGRGQAVEAKASITPPAALVGSTETVSAYLGESPEHPARGGRLIGWSAWAPVYQSSPDRRGRCPAGSPSLLPRLSPQHRKEVAGEATLRVAVIFHAMQQVSFLCPSFAGW